MFGRMIVSALTLTSVAYAQEAAPGSTDRAADECSSRSACSPGAALTSSDRVVYDAAFFAQFNPQTALDMVRQTPGFTLDGGEGRRGFSGAVGNLLIDGIRPSTKSQSIEGIVSRIPADQVVRIELLRGAEVAGDASRQTVLLNVVRTRTAGSGVWQAGALIRPGQAPAPIGEASYSGRGGNIEYGLGGSLYTDRNDTVGWRRFTDATGASTGRADTPTDREIREATLNGNVAFPIGEGQLSVTSQIRWSNFQALPDLHFFDAADAPLYSRLARVEDESVGVEIGANYDRDFGPWSLALIGLVNRGRYENQDNGEWINGPIASDAQNVRQDTGESILRASLSRSLATQHRIEIGGEAAYNTLDQALVYAIDGEPQPIPNSNVLVEEERAELFGSHTWRPNDRWSVETRLAWEASTLSFSGDDNQSVDLSYFKPSVQVTRTFSANNQVRLRVYRDVGQLDFNDFVSAAAIADDIITGGNTDLVPQTAWRAELGADLRLSGGAALRVALTRHFISDVADFVQLSFPNPNEDPNDPNDNFIRFDAPGNIGDGEASSLDVNFSTPISFIPGGRLRIDGFLWDTEVTDPITGGSRIISNQPESQIAVDFRQDLQDLRFAWGFNVFKRGEVQVYRFNEIDTTEDGPWTEVFVETTALPNNLKLRLSAANTIEGRYDRDRRFFGPDRNGSFTHRDLRRREFAQSPWFILQLSGRF